MSDKDPREAMTWEDLYALHRITVDVLYETEHERTMEVLRVFTEGDDA